MPVEEETVNDAPDNLQVLFAVEGGKVFELFGQT